MGRAQYIYIYYIYIFMSYIYIYVLLGWKHRGPKALYYKLVRAHCIYSLMISSYNICVSKSTIDIVKIDTRRDFLRNSIRYARFSRVFFRRPRARIHSCSTAAAGAPAAEWIGREKIPKCLRM